MRKLKAITTITLKACLIISVCLSNVSAAQEQSTNTLATKLQNSSVQIKRNVISDSEKKLQQNSRRIKLQMQADQLRTQLGATSDTASRNAINLQYENIQKQLRALR